MKIANKIEKIFLTVILCAGVLLPTQAIAEDENADLNSNQTEDEFSIDDVNFYVNLAGEVLDVKDKGGHYDKGLFTNSVGYLAVDGDELQQKVKANTDYFSIFNNKYDSIAGIDENDYVNIDKQIRATIDVPSDASILTNIKKEIENGTEVNDINGDKISSTLVSEKYFDVYWYVLKEGQDHWHVDGILKKKDPPLINTYTVNYQWKVDGGPGLPANVAPPAQVIYAENDTVKIDDTFTPGKEVSVEGGFYGFIGWDKEDFIITEDTVVNGIWQWVPNEYNVITNFKDLNSEEDLKASIGKVYAGGDEWSYITPPERIFFNGKMYKYDSTTGAEDVNNPITENKEVTHWYVLESIIIRECNLTQNYKIYGTDVEIKDKWSKSIQRFSPYEFEAAPQEIEYNGTVYKLKEVTGDNAFGEYIIRDLSRTAWYEEKTQEQEPVIVPSDTPKVDEEKDFNINEDDKEILPQDDENSTVDESYTLGETGDDEPLNNLIAVIAICLLVIFVCYFAIVHRPKR